MVWWRWRTGGCCRKNPPSPHFGCHPMRSRAAPCAPLKINGAGTVVAPPPVVCVLMVGTVDLFGNICIWRLHRDTSLARLEAAVHATRRQTLSSYSLRLGWRGAGVYCSQVVAFHARRTGASSCYGGGRFRRRYRVRSAAPQARLRANSARGGMAAIGCLLMLLSIVLLSNCGAIP